MGVRHISGPKFMPTVIIHPGLSAEQPDDLADLLELIELRLEACDPDPGDQVACPAVRQQVL